MFVVMCGVCKCVYSCMFYADSTVALDSGHMVVAEYGNLVHHAISPVPSVANNSGSSGEESGDSAQELFVLSVYSVEAMIVVEPVRDSTSNTYGCALLLVGRDGQVTATSEWIPVWVVQCMYVLVYVGYIVCAQRHGSW